MNGGMVKIYYDHEEMDTSLTSVVDENEDRTRRFQTLVHKANSFASNIDVITEKALEEWDPHFKEKLDNYEDDLKMEAQKRAIVIVGDTSAGKSSLLNLLFGGDIFPTSHLHTTSTVCRIYAGEDKVIVPWTQDMEQLPAVAWEDEQELKQWLKDNVAPKRKSSGASRRRAKEECPFKYVDIYVQTSFIKDPLFLVDTPGTGKDETISEAVLNYIENAAGLICVINVANAGGIREKGLRDILNRIEHNSSTTMLGFDPENAIFIFNKMDTVPQNEQKDVREDLVEDLKEIFPKVPDGNILFFSVHDVDKGSKADLELLYGLINKMVDRSLSAKSRNCESWLCDLLQKSCGSPDSRVKECDAERQADRVKDRLQAVEKLLVEFEEELKSKVEDTRKDMAEEHQHRIHSDPVRRRLIAFDGTAVINPRPKESWEDKNRRQRHQTKQNLESYVSEILVSELSDIVRERLKKVSTENLHQKKKRISECIENMQYLEDLSKNFEANTQSVGVPAMLAGLSATLAAKRFLRPAASLLVGAAFVTKGAWIATAGLVIGAVVYKGVQGGIEKRESEMTLNQLIIEWTEQIVSSITENDTRAKVLHPVQEYLLACAVDGKSKEIALQEFSKETLERWWIQIRLQNMSIELSNSTFAKKMSESIAGYKKILEKMTSQQKKRLLLCANDNTREQANILLEEIGH